MLFSVLPLFLLSTPSYGADARKPSAQVALRDLAKPRFFGTAANTTFLFNDKNYTNIVNTQFSIFTPENEMKWETIEPFQNVFNFTPADEIVKFAHSVGGKVRGHNFMWGNQLAPWVNSSLTATELDRALKNHIDTIMKHYKGQLYAWDVINELISDTPNITFKDNIWTQKFGEEAMPKALTYARAADPSVKLYVNDYGIEGVGFKSNALFDVVSGFIRDGIPIDAVGFQAHFGLGQVPTDLQQNLQRFADLGLDVAITELDINLRGPPNATSLAQQADDFAKVVSACVAVKRCVSITTWGVSDDHSWLAPNGHPLLFDEVKNAKPAFFSVAHVLQ